MVGFFSTAKGLGVSRGLGPGVGLLGSELRMRALWGQVEPSIRLVLLESARGPRCSRAPTTPVLPASSSTSVAILTTATWLSTVCRAALVSVATAG